MTIRTTSSHARRRPCRMASGGLLAPWVCVGNWGRWRALSSREEGHFRPRLGEDDERIDWDKLARKWDKTIGGELADQSEVCDFDARPRDHVPSPEVQEQAIRDALAQVQAQHSTWTKSDLMRSLAWQMGPEFDAMTADDREAMLSILANKAVSSTAYGVACLEAPEGPTVPPPLIRGLDGRSVHTPPGTDRYATPGQLAR